MAAVELRGFGFLPGHYTCRCIDCPDIRDAHLAGNRNQFQGGKGAYRCETHATAAMARHQHEATHAAELARPGLMILVGDSGLRITGMIETDYGHGLHISALTKRGDAIEFAAKRIFNRERSEPEIAASPDPWAGKTLIRCMGGKHCDHGRRQCTADPEYQAYLASQQGHCPGHVASEDDKKICGRCGVHIDELR